MKGALILLLMLVFAGTAQAQLNRDDPLDPAGNARNPQVNNPAEEMRYRAAVRHEEEAHREMVERADEIGEISSQLLKSFNSNNSLGRDDLKKLERIEKLARKIRSKAGGSDAEKSLESPPAQLEAAITQLADLSEQLQDGMKKTSRMVVSAAVIERSNEMIELVKIIRTFVSP